MRIDVDVMLKSHAGEQLQERLVDPDTKEVTVTDIDLKTVCCQALMLGLEGEKPPMTGPSSVVSRRVFAARIHEGGRVKMSSEEVSDLKKRINTMAWLQAVGAALEALEADEDDEKNTEEDPKKE